MCELKNEWLKAFIEHCNFCKKNFKRLLIEDEHEREHPSAKIKNLKTKQYFIPLCLGRKEKKCLNNYEVGRNHLD